MFKSITDKEANLWADIIFANEIDRPIHLSFPDIDVEINVETIDDMYFDNIKDGGSFRDKHGNAALRHNGKHYEVGYYFNNWYSDHLIHINFFSKKHHAQFLTEFELGQCLKDNKYIYFLKRIDRLAGVGSMVRLFSGAASKPEKFERIRTLIAKLGAETITHDKAGYMVAHKVKIADLEKKSAYPPITREFLSSWITFSFCIEEIRSSF